MVLTGGISIIYGAVSLAASSSPWPILVQIKAIHLGHPDVKKYQIVHACLEVGKRLRRIIECRNLEAVVF